MGGRKWKTRVMTLVMASFMAFIAAGCTNKQSEKENIPDQASAVREEQSQKEDTLTENRTGVDNQGSALPHLVSSLYTDFAYADGSDEYYGEFRYEGVTLSREDAEYYPELAQALEKHRDSRYKALREEYNSFLEDVDYVSEEGEPVYRVYDTTVTSVVRADDTLVSLKSHLNIYNGGAHGYYGNTGDTFDTRSGKALLLTDIIRDEEEFKAVLVDEMLENCFPYDEEENQDYRRNTIESYLADNPDLSDSDAYPWVIGYEGITVYFNPYTLFSYAEGMQVVDISFSEYPELFHEAYTETPRSYVTGITEGETMHVDLDGDGKANSFYLTSLGPDQDDNYDYGTLALELDGERVETDVNLYTMDPYLVKADQGRYFLYVFGRVENDYSILRIFSLDGTPKEVEQYSMAPAVVSYGNGEEEPVVTEAFTDPERIVMEQHIDLLSTYCGRKTFHIEETGLPVSDDAWFTLNQDNLITLTALREVDGKIVDESGKETAAATIEKGDTCILYRTDGESFVDLKLEDGSLVRIKVQGDGWPRTINGIEEDQVFEGMRYAG